MRRSNATLLRRAPNDPAFATKSLTGGFLGAFVWDRADARLGWQIASGDVLRQGELSVTQLPEYRFGAFDVDAVRWRSNGLQLRAGETASVTLRERLYNPTKQAWEWYYPTQATGRVTLAPHTRIVAITVGVIVINGERPDQSAGQLTEADAEAWFNGRHVDQQHVAVSDNSRNLNVVVLDRDPRPAWTLANYNDASAGRSQNNLATMQDPDHVWSQCGAAFGVGIQFRMVRYQRIEASRGGIGCDVIARNPQPAGLPPRSFERCFTEWANLTEMPGQRSIPIVVVPRYFAAGRGQGAYAEEFLHRIVLGLLDQASSDHPHRENIIAHELGHALGGTRGFADNYVDPSDHPVQNLMNDWSPRLTRAQCEEAWGNALQYVVQ